MLDFTKTLQPDEPLVHPSCVVKNLVGSPIGQMVRNCSFPHWMVYRIDTYSSGNGIEVRLERLKI